MLLPFQTGISGFHFEVLLPAFSREFSTLLCKLISVYSETWLLILGISLVKIFVVLSREAQSTWIEMASIDTVDSLVQMPLLERLTVSF